MTLCQKVVNTAGGIFLPGGENLKRSDFDFDGFSKLKQYSVNNQHQLKTKLA